MEGHFQLAFLYHGDASYVALTFSPTLVCMQFSVIIIGFVNRILFCRLFMCKVSCVNQHEYFVKVSAILHSCSI